MTNLIFGINSASPTPHDFVLSLSRRMSAINIIFGSPLGIQRFLAQLSPELMVHSSQFISIPWVYWFYFCLRDLVLWDFFQRTGLKLLAYGLEWRVNRPLGLPESIRLVMAARLHIVYKPWSMDTMWRRGRFVFLGLWVGCGRGELLLISGLGVAGGNGWA